MKKIKLLLLVVMSSVLVACGDDGNKDDPKYVAKSFVEALVRSDSKKVLDLIYIPPKMQAAIDKDPKVEYTVKEIISVMIVEFSLKVEHGGGLKEIAAGEPEYNDDKNKATVLIMINLKKDYEGPYDIDLIKTDDGWKVVNW